MSETRRYRQAVSLAAVTALLSWTALAGAADKTALHNEKSLARHILAETGIKGGLVVHLGCGDGRLTAALRAGRSFLVQGLDADRADVEAARRHVHALDVYGPVSIRQHSGPGLPYADGLVNLVVREDAPGVPLEEILRVLSPGGVLYARQGDHWTKTIKPWPEEIDTWSHFLHDASNNAVARDSAIGPPRRLKWISGPLWSRSHEHTSSLSAMVSSGGRLFYVLDEGLTGVTPRTLPDRWTLVARDAFSGVLLWKRAVPKWRSGQWKNRALRSIPATIPRRIVADGDRLYTTLGHEDPVSVLDAATGRTLAIYEGTEGTEEVRLVGGILLVRKQRGPVAAIDTKTGKRLWQATGKIRPVTLAALDDRVWFQDGTALVCRHLREGKELWRQPLSGAVSLLVAHEDQLVMLIGRGLHTVSASTGESLWQVDAGVSRRELFVAAGRLWHWQGEGIVGRDPATGEVVAHPDTDDVFSPGHHLRCYQSKATEEFLITPHRGVEFVSLTGGANTQSDWIRGACAYGVMPANGLLYIPPHPCFCYPGVKLNGLNALAPKAKGDPDAPVESARLKRGPAYGAKLSRSSPATAAATGDWPTYRHDGRRSGAAGCSVDAEVSERWRVKLAGKLSPPVVADGRVFVAAKETHAIVAISVDSGESLWRYTAGGPIDSPPSVVGDRVLFGCTDGCVYCLRATDGELVWRFRAAPTNRQIIAFGQLESPWRVHGSVLIEDGTAYFTAGRSSYLDGGIRVFGLDPASGQIVCQAKLNDWARTREDARGKPFIPAYHMEGTRSDILVSQGGFIYLGQVKFDRKLVRQEVPYVMPDPANKHVAMDLSKEPYIAEDENPKSDYEDHQRQWLERTQQGLLERLRQKHGGYSLGDRRMGLHVFSTSGFLDDSWFNRTFWMYSATWPGFYLAHRAPKTGQLLCVGPEKTYAVQAYPSRNLQSPLFTPGEKGYLLQADANDNEPVLDYRTRGTTKGWGFTRDKPPVWHQWVPVRTRAMVLAGSALFAAGPPDVIDPDDPMAAFEGRKGALLRAHSATDGRLLAEHRLDAPPVFDGLIAVPGRLLLCTTQGHVVCLAEQTPDGAGADDR